MKYLFLIILFVSFFFSSCKKEAGEGGKASISGKVWLKEYNSNFSTLQLEREAFDEYVYIQYGDDISYGDRIKTSYDGSYEFKYLRPGKYKIYCYSKDPEDKDNVQPEKMMVILKEVEITEKKQQVELELITIYS